MCIKLKWSLVGVLPNSCNDAKSGPIKYVIKDICVELKGI